MIKIRKYKIEKELGEGGNGVVYAVNDGTNEFALKTLKNFAKSGSYSRFRDEIEALKIIKNTAGIMKMIDWNLPEQSSDDDPPYYVMPRGIDLAKSLAGKPHNILFEAFLKIVTGVVNLHSREFTHRDIKPNNMLMVDNEPVLSDFGLVSFPDKTHVSKANEKIGAQWTIAPEMQRTSSTAEFKKADVYSLAKSLWILITGVSTGFEGQYVQNSVISLNKYVDVQVNKVTMGGHWYYFSIVKLEKLLVRATDNDPINRPSAIEFYTELNDWYKSNNDYFLRNAYEWADGLERIFPLGIPAKAEWNGAQTIGDVLQVICQYDNSNYCFFPPRGGEDLKTIVYNQINEYIVINKRQILIPDKLLFYSLGDTDWSYFRLVIKPIKALSEDIDEHSEEYRGDENFNYLGEFSEDNERPIGSYVRRYLKGSILIVQKTGRINNLSGRFGSYYLDGHSGTHDELSYDDYNEMLTVIRSKGSAQKTRR